MNYQRELERSTLEKTVFRMVTDLSGINTKESSELVDTIKRQYDYQQEVYVVAIERLVERNKKEYNKLATITI